LLLMWQRPEAVRLEEARRLEEAMGMVEAR
jgi:hypothetical protein